MPGQSWADLPAARGLVAALAHPPACGPLAVGWALPLGTSALDRHRKGAVVPSPPHGVAPTPALRGPPPDAPPSCGSSWVSGPGPRLFCHQALEPLGLLPRGAGPEWALGPTVRAHQHQLVCHQGPGLTGMGLWAGRLCLFGKMRLVIRTTDRSQDTPAPGPQQPLSRPHRHPAAARAWCRGRSVTAVCGAVTCGPVTRGHCCPGLTTCCSEVPSSLRPLGAGTSVWVHAFTPEVGRSQAPISPPLKPNHTLPPAKGTRWSLSVGRHPGLGSLVPGPGRPGSRVTCALCCGDQTTLCCLPRWSGWADRWVQCEGAGGEGGQAHPHPHEPGLTKQSVQNVAQSLWDLEVSRSYFLGQSAFPLGLGSETDPP